jgi:enoyl-CoA hydratase/carnithine racemase
MEERMPLVTYDIRDRVAEISLRRPPVNALSESVLDELLACLGRAAGDPAVRAVILGSAVPKHFCAGLDLRKVGTMEAPALRRSIEKLYLGLYDAQRRLCKPSIAAIEGTARGGGMTLAISCDLIVAGRSASFGYPEIDIGVVPAIHYAHLATVAGRYRAFDLLFTARSFDAEEAASLGLVNRVVEGAQLIDHARDLAQSLVRKPIGAMAFGRAAFRQEVEDDYRAQLVRAVERFCAVAGTDEAKARIEAFLDRRRS